MFVFHPSASDPDLKPLHAPRPEPGPEVRELKSEIERLYFITEALWRILKERHQLDDLEIVRQITAIDMEDDKLDGRKARTPPQPCPKCGRPGAKMRARCMYCGEYQVTDPFDR